MPVVSLRALIIFRKSGQTSNFNCWIVKRFPTVELRARRLGLPELPSSDYALSELCWEKINHQPDNLLNDFEQEFHLFGFALDEDDVYVLNELLVDLKAIVRASIVPFNDELSKQTVLLNLLKAIPFGTPIQTQVPAICSNYYFGYSKDAKCDVPSNGRALPNWFPGVHEENRLKTFASSLTRSTDLVFWIEETVNAILYKHEEEFQDEMDSVKFYSVSSNLYCISRCRSATQVVVTLKSRSQDFVYGVHECVQQIDRDEAMNDSVDVIFTPPPRAFEDHPFILSRWRSEEYHPPLTSHWEEQFGEYPKELNPGYQPKWFLPVKLTYRLRKSNYEGTEFQIIVRIERRREHAQFSHLSVKLIIPGKILHTKLQSSGGNVELNDSQLIWKGFFEKKQSNSNFSLLSGIIYCEENLVNTSNYTFYGETSCAVLDFEISQNEAATDVEIVNISSGDQTIYQNNRIVKSGKFIVWNPFGEYIKGDFL